MDDHVDREYVTQAVAAMADRLKEIVGPMWSMDYCVEVAMQLVKAIPDVRRDDVG